ALDRLGERGARPRRGSERGELALVGVLERDALGVGTIEIALDRRIFDPGVKVVEIPFRQRAEAARRLRLGGGGGTWFRGLGNPFVFDRRSVRLATTTPFAGFRWPKQARPVDARGAPLGQAAPPARAADPLRRLNIALSVIGHSAPIRHTRL